MNYRVTNDDLIVEDSTGQMHWQGRPEQRAVDWAATVPGSSDGLALYHYYRKDHPYGGFENLVRVRPDGSILWHAELPESNDKYVSAQLVGGKLFASSYSGYHVEVNIESGRIVSKQFSK